MNLDQLEVAAKAVLQAAMDELGAVSNQRAAIERTRHYHRQQLRDAKVELDRARGKLPDALARLWVARCEGDAKAEKAVSAEIAALRKVIDHCVELEQQSATVSQGLTDLDKRLNQVAHGEVGSGPKYRRDNAVNVLNRLELAKREGIHSNGHGSWLKFHAEKLGVGFGYEQPRSEALAA